MAGSSDWRPLAGVTGDELTLHHTLPVGQSFRWRKAGPNYAGVVGRRAFLLRQAPTTTGGAAKTAGAAPARAGAICWRLASRPPPGADPDAELAAAEAALLDYLNLGPGRPRLSELSRQWAAADEGYRAVAAALPGARMLRQAPLECLFSFVCSSNNHISRIHGMVERLCASYGGAIELEPWAARELAALAARGLVVPATPATLGDGDEDDEEDGEEAGKGGKGAAEQQAATEAAWAAALGGGGEQQQGQEQEDVVVRVELATPPPPPGAGNKGKQQGRRASSSSSPPPGAPAAPAFWAFPTLEQLAAASEEALRADGFGYRARYISGSVALLRAKAAAAAAAAAAASTNENGKAAAAASAANPLSADAWLLSLRSPDVPLERAVELLTELPGVGPKVASCVALFALDKHGAVPVDTHVWDLAKRRYAREALRGKSAPTAALHPVVQKAFLDAFGPYAGWAHNALFVGELPAFQARIRRAAAAARAGGRAAGAAAAAGGKTDGAAGAGLSGDGQEEDSDDDEEDSDFELRTPAAAAAEKGKRKGSSSGKKRPKSAEAVAREERRRRRSGDDGVPMPFESLLS